MIDTHLHTCFSGDSDAPVEEMIEEAIRLGLSRICITDHYDPEWVPQEEETDPISFELKTDSYFRKLSAMQAQYSDKIEIDIGVELGVQPHLTQFLKDYVKKYPFDYVIASTHLINGRDPYYPSFFDGRPQEDAYMEFFKATLKNLYAFPYADAVGHLDYIVRYGPQKDKGYSYKKYASVLDRILRFMAEKNMALEINTSAYGYDLSVPNPTPDIIRRYLELGGPYITLGSDAHDPEHIAQGYDRVLPLLRECGVKEITTFHKRKPASIPIEA